MGRVITLTGPSGSGKTTIARTLQERFPDEFGEIVSYTTRAMRGGEIEGVDYYFLSEEEFAFRKGNDEFLEIVEFNGKNYASSFVEADQSTSDKDAFVILEPHGVDQWKKNYPQGKFIHIFIRPSSTEVLKERMAFQGRTAQQIDERIAHDATVFAVDLAGYNLVAVNTDLEATCRAIRQFVRSQ